MRDTDALLIFKVAPEVANPPVQNVALDDVRPASGDALGGSDAAYVGNYQVTCELPDFVGHAAYVGERLLIRFPSGHVGELSGPTGIFEGISTRSSAPLPSPPDKAGKRSNSSCQPRRCF